MKTKKKKYRVLRVGERLRASDQVFWTDGVHWRMGSSWIGAVIQPKTSQELPQGRYRREVK